MEKIHCKECGKFLYCDLGNGEECYDCQVGANDHCIFFFSRKEYTGECDKCKSEGSYNQKGGD